MAWLLCKKEDVLALHPISIDEIKDEWSTMVEGLIRQYMGYKYLGTTQAITDEYHNGNGADTLRVHYPPIDSVTSISINDSAISASDYIVFKNYIQLKNSIFPFGRLNVKVSYVSGSTDIDDEVKFTCATMIVAIINYRKRYGADSSLRWATPDRQTGEDSPSKNVGLNTHLKQIMKESLPIQYLRVR